MNEQYPGPHYFTDEVEEMIRTKRHLDLVLKPGNIYDLLILKSDPSRAVIIAAAVSSNKISLEKMKNGAHHRTVPLILIPNENPTIDDIAKELPGAIHNYFPKAAGYPIRLYKEHDSKEPLLEVRIVNDLVNIIHPGKKAADAA